MVNLDSQHRASPSEAPILGDHLAMDLLNTQAQDNGAVIEFWNSGDDVLAWLARCGAVATAGQAQVGRADLLTQARALRTLARRLIVQRKDDAMADIGGLNDYLGAHLSVPHLEHDGSGKLVLTRVARGEPDAALLGPVAEAVAQLLVDGDFTLVKQCEHPDCILWFYDRTKAHKRRWCSMAVCGNRHKAAQFRKKTGDASA